jgi:hypothetical protein
MNSHPKSGLGFSSHGLGTIYTGCGLGTLQVILPIGVNTPLPLQAGQIILIPSFLTCQPFPSQHLQVLGGDCTILLVLSIYPPLLFKAFCAYETPSLRISSTASFPFRISLSRSCCSSGRKSERTKSITLVPSGG